MSELYNAISMKSDKRLAGAGAGAIVRGGAANRNRIRSIRSRTSLYYEGDPRTYAFEILCGTARLVRRTADGQRLILDFKSSGDVVGICAGSHYDHAVEMITSGKVHVIQYARSENGDMDLSSTSPKGTLCRAFASDLAHTRNHLMILALKNPRERVATFLTEMALRHQFHAPATKDDAIVLRLPMSRRDIADYLGLTPETICRTFAHFRKLGVICSPSCSRVHILDWARLVDCAGSLTESVDGV